MTTLIASTLFGFSGGATVMWWWFSHNHLIRTREEWSLAEQKIARKADG